MAVMIGFDWAKQGSHVIVSNAHMCPNVYTPPTPYDKTSPASSDAVHREGQRPYIFFLCPSSQRRPPTITMRAPGKTSRLTPIYTHLRHTLLYLLWTIFYLYLTLLHPIITTALPLLDALHHNTPLHHLRPPFIKLLRFLFTRLTPGLARKYLSHLPVGTYLGADRHLLSHKARKQIPFHSVSLNGCAWMLPYHIGVVEVFSKHGLVDGQTKWLGSSGGALIATAAALQLDMKHQLNFCIDSGVHAAQSHALGPLGVMSHYIAPHIKESLPADAHTRCTGRLFISVTETPQMDCVYGNRIISQYGSVGQVYDALIASTYIPVYYERPAKPGVGVFYYDGGFSCNQPVFFEDGVCVTTTVSPNAGAADVCPGRQTSCSIEHLFPGGVEGAMENYNLGKRVGERYVGRMKELYGSW